MPSVPEEMPRSPRWRSARWAVVCVAAARTNRRSILVRHRRPADATEDASVNAETIGARSPPLVSRRAPRWVTALTSTDLLADPMTLAVMAAERVDPAALKAELNVMVRRLKHARPAAPMRDYVGRNDRPW
jgi:hypothetical protein